jgi:hypothetical protein
MELGPEPWAYTLALIRLTFELWLCGITYGRGSGLGPGPHPFPTFQNFNIHIFKLEPHNNVISWPNGIAWC